MRWLWQRLQCLVAGHLTATLATYGAYTITSATGSCFRCGAKGLTLDVDHVETSSELGRPFNIPGTYV